ncbi:MAG: sodium:proton antiporter [Myxococcota bacterium]
MPDASLALGATLSPLWVAPFVALLLCIALMPLRAPHFWEQNRNKLFVALGLGLPVGLLIALKDPHTLVHTLADYISFIVLLGSLFTAAGGIVLRGDLRATPEVNAAFLAAGAVFSNLIGTTGASMLFIRPVLRTNSERRNTGHIPVFFIFIVSNAGGLLTPLGDPPLFLGYLQGVPFFWTLRLWPVWLLCVGALLAVFYAWDSRAYAREKISDLRFDEIAATPLVVVGKRNLVFLGGIVGAVFLPPPWREATMVAMGAGSLLATPREYRRENGFSWGAIVEVAALFAGIFLTMIPALLILEARGAAFGITRPWQFFWLTGALSSFLDNAPTYLTFLSLAQSLGAQGALDAVVGVPGTLLAAISAGAVLMGANSYIGNGPNFMVKAIAEEYRFRMPSFFGYMAIAAAVLLPIFLVATLLFFRG